MTIRGPSTYLDPQNIPQTRWNTKSIKRAKGERKEKKNQNKSLRTHRLRSKRNDFFIFKVI
jgi:hypothetical protein